MFKQIVSIVIILISFISCNENFEKLPDNHIGDTYLLKQIRPDNKIKYWQIDYLTGYTPYKIFSNGNHNLSTIIPLPHNPNPEGFFSGYHAFDYNYRILYIENNQWHFVQNLDELKKFIGKIDNKFEAFLIARIHDYNIDSDSKGNGFQKTQYGYQLKVMIYNICPETKQSIIVTVDENGRLNKLKNSGYYLKSKDCITY